MFLRTRYISLPSLQIQRMPAVVWCGHLALWYITRVSTAATKATLYQSHACLSNEILILIFNLNIKSRQILLLNTIFNFIKNNSFLHSNSLHWKGTFQDSYIFKHFLPALGSPQFCTGFSQYESYELLYVIWVWSSQNDFVMLLKGSHVAWLHVSSCINYDSNTLMPVVWKVWHW